VELAIEVKLASLLAKDVWGTTGVVLHLLLSSNGRKDDIDNIGEGSSHMIPMYCRTG
jgi:hypothetical protein